MFPTIATIAAIKPANAADAADLIALRKLAAAQDIRANRRAELATLVPFSLETIATELDHNVATSKETERFMVAMLANLAA